MKIAVVHPFQFRYRRGIERFTWSITNEWVKLGEEVHLITWDVPEPVDWEPVENLHIFRVPNFRYYQSRFTVPFYAFQLLKLKPDVVITYFAGYGEGDALRLVGNFIDPMYVFIVGYPIEQAPHQFEFFKTTQLGAKLDLIVPKAEFMVESLSEYFQKPAQSIPNGVNTDYFAPPSPPRQPGYDLLTVAAIEQRKGFEPVLNAMPELAEDFPDLHYTIVGDGPDRAWLQELIQQKNLEDRVTLAGKQFDVRPYLAAADIFLLPSYGEGLPNAWLEALASGLPSIVSTDPPYPQVAKAEFSVQVQRDNHQQMVNTIRELLQNREKSVAMGQAARQHAEQNYSWQKVAQRYLDLFNAHKA